MKKIKVNPKIILSFLIIILVLLLLLKFVVFNNSTSKYGNRLDSIKNIEYKEKNQKEYIKKIKENDKILKADIIVKGKIVNIITTVKDDTSRDDLKKIANDSLEKIDEKIKTNYDIQFFAYKKTKSEKNEFPMIGYKNNKKDKFVW